MLRPLPQGEARDVDPGLDAARRSESSWIRGLEHRNEIRCLIIFYRVRDGSNRPGNKGGKTLLERMFVRVERTRVLKK